jgi:hypothetical protein
MVDRAVSEFVTPLDVRRLPADGSADRRGTWKLLADLVYRSDLLARTVTAPAGMVTDFASVPRIPVAYLLAGDTGHQAAVIHDLLYTTHEVNRAHADAVFREALRCDGGPAWRAWMMWAGVRLGGAGPWQAAGQEQPGQVAAQIAAGGLVAP